MIYYYKVRDLDLFFNYMPEDYIVILRAMMITGIEYEEVLDKFPVFALDSYKNVFVYTKTTSYTCSPEQVIGVWEFLC
jgi:hypothetical protein